MGGDAQGLGTGACSSRLEQCGVGGPGQLWVWGWTIEGYFLSLFPRLCERDEASLGLSAGI